MKLDCSYSYTPQTINNWEHRHTPPSIKVLDPLWLFAQSRGHKDLRFYVPPSFDSG